jgi:hypothetical protein
MGGREVDCSGSGQEQVAELLKAVMNFHMTTNLHLLIIPRRCGS